MAEGAVSQRHAPLMMTLDLPMHADAAPRARRALHDVFVAWNIRDDEWMYDALLVVSELVGNAFRHGGDRIHLEATYRQRLRISVTDGSSIIPRMRSEVDPDDEAGRGMTIVDALTDSWGVDDLDGGGKRVWAEMPARRADLATS